MRTFSRSFPGEIKMIDRLIPNNVLFSTLTKQNDNGNIDEVMIGAVMSFASKNIKTGWLPCNGQEVSRSQYPKLFKMIGTTYGTPGNNTVFKLPNLNGNKYFIRGGDEIGKEQLGTPQTIDGYDHGSAHGFGLWYTPEIRTKYGKMITMNELADSEKFGDNLYTLPAEQYKEYKDFLKHLWNDSDTGSGGVDPGTISRQSGHMAMVSRPKNMTMYYCIYAGNNQVSKPPIDTSYNAPAETPRLSLNASNPIGSVTMYAGNTLAPEGWMFCHGQVLSRTKYAKLFAVLGTTYGSTAADNFKLPDYRNQFLRGTSEQRAINTRETDAIRNITGEMAFVRRGPRAYNNDADAAQDSALYTKEKWNTLIKAGGQSDIWGSVVKFDASRSVPTADEVRPVNVSVHYIIYTGIIG